ncbi:hypothetical protein AOQ88_01025 [Candidatus Riesia sp. GBBU]|nr:hypothetical protein AOQ88_01025 [Candidatus Riesia sp. GBBU]
MFFFISDIHLREDNSKSTEIFLKFLKKYAIKAKSIYILGDLFDYWIGDDKISKYHIKISKELKRLSKRGTSCFFIRGNRDFLLGKKFIKKSGMILLNDEEVINLYKRKILLLHGDVLCEKDTVYKIYRDFVRNYFVQKIFLFLPRSLRVFIVKIIKTNSIVNNNKFVDIKIVKKIFLKYDCNYIIHGHLHKYEVNKLFNKKLCKISLGGWEKYAYISKMTKKGFSLIKLT